MDNVKKAKGLVEPFLMSESLDEKIRRVKRKSESLRAREEDIREELKYAESLWLKRPKREVECWLEHVAQMVDEVRKAEQEVLDTHHNWFPNFHLPTKLDRLMTEVEDLRRQGDFSQGLTLGAQEIRGVTFPTTRLLGQRFQANKKLIIESMMDDHVLRVGMYGMGGVGKTTLLTHVNNELVQSCSDVSVVWVTVSQQFRLQKLQDDIAGALKFNFSCEVDEKKRAAELWTFLERMKNLVLILDDVWEDILLDKVGVCVRGKGCKLIITTRDIAICRRMDCDKKIEVQPLCEEESWELFKDKLGDHLMLSTPEIKEVAKSLVRECAGLPLGIITMARSMKGVDDLFEWRNALENMKEPKPGHDHLEIELFQVLKHSYDMLKDPIVQQCFLDCSLYPEDFKIGREDLINMFIYEGLIDGMSSRQPELDRGHTILNKLVNACLLENCETNGEKCVKMHDLVRDMALRITSNNPRFLVVAGKGKKYIPAAKVWKEDLAKVSLMYNHILRTPSNFEPPKCPRLSTLLLNFSGLSRMSDNFFLDMKGIVFLDLSNTLIEKLPKSTSELVNLSALLLRECWQLKYIPSLAKLTELKKLDLYGTGVIHVPDGIRDLVKLRHLNLPNGLSIGTTERDIIQLTRLENLRCIFRDQESFNTYVRTLQERGPAYYQLHLLKASKKIGYPSNVGYLRRAVLMRHLFVRKSVASAGSFSLLLPKCVEALSIEESTMEASCLCDVVSFSNVINFRSLNIDVLSGIKYLFSYSNTNVFRTIETLSVWRMNNMLGLISRRQGLSYPHVTFYSLKTLHLFGHGNRCMEILFADSDQFPNLEALEVRGFKSLVEIISTTRSTPEKEADDLIVIVNFPKLLKLVLFELRSLQSVAVISDSVQSVDIWDCPKLRRIPLLDRVQCLTSLQQVRIDEVSMDSLEWDHLKAKDAIRNLINTTA